MRELVSKHYDEKYFDWQSSMGEFGGWAEQTKFLEYIGNNSDVLDFGCGGGFLLGRLRCRKKWVLKLTHQQRRQQNAGGSKYSIVWRKFLTIT